MARKIAGDTSDLLILQCAREAAQAEFDLAQIRRVKVALIEHMRKLDEFVATQPDFSGPEASPFLYEFLMCSSSSKPVEAIATMPATAPGRITKAVRRALPELLKLDRYERRAAARRERSLGTINSRKR